MVIFCKLLLIFLGRNTPNNRFIDVKNKKTNKVVHCWYASAINLEQLIFTWKGRQLVLALFVGSFEFKVKFLDLFKLVFFVRINVNKKTLRVVTIVMICSNLASLWKFKYFRGPIYNPVKHLWWSFYCENSKS